MPTKVRSFSNLNPPIAMPLFLLALLPICFAAPSPVIVTIETDSSKSLHLGPYDRTRFDLVEEFHPLQTASVARGEQLEELRHRVQGVRQLEVNPTGPFSTQGENFAVPASKEGLQDGNTATTEPQRRIVFGEWQPWSSWTMCLNGERSRHRACVSRRTAARVVCHGEAREVQKCYSSSERQTAVANDPWSIEREISGDFKA